MLQLSCVHPVYIGRWITHEQIAYWHGLQMCPYTVIIPYIMSFYSLSSVRQNHPYKATSQDWLSVYTLDCSPMYVSWWMLFMIIILKLQVSNIIIIGHGLWYLAEQQLGFSNIYKVLIYTSYYRNSIQNMRYGVWITTECGKHKIIYQIMLSINYNHVTN